MNLIWFWAKMQHFGYMVLLIFPPRGNLFEAKFCGSECPSGNEQRILHLLVITISQAAYFKEIFLDNSHQTYRENVLWEVLFYTINFMQHFKEPPPPVVHITLWEICTCAHVYCFGYSFDISLIFFKKKNIGGRGERGWFSMMLAQCFL